MMRFPSSRTRNVSVISCPLLERLTMKLLRSTLANNPPFPKLECVRLKSARITNFHNMIPGLQSLLSASPSLESIHVDDQGPFEYVQLRHDTLSEIRFEHTKGEDLWLEMPNLNFVRVGITKLQNFKIRSSAPMVTGNYKRPMLPREVSGSPGGNNWIVDLP